MKQLTMTLILPLFLTLLSCNMNDPGDPPGDDGLVRCTINDDDWKADMLAHIVYDDVMGNISVHGVHEGTETALMVDASNCDERRFRGEAFQGEEKCLPGSSEEYDIIKFGTDCRSSSVEPPP